MKRLRITIIKATGPAHWSSYLVNGDPSTFDYFGDDGSDQAAADRFAQEHGLCVDSTDIGFQLSCDAPGQLPGTMAEYTFHAREGVE